MDVALFPPGTSPAIGLALRVAPEAHGATEIGHAGIHRAARRRWATTGRMGARGGPGLGPGVIRNRALQKRHVKGRKVTEGDRDHVYRTSAVPLRASSRPGCPPGPGTLSARALRISYQRAAVGCIGGFLRLASPGTTSSPATAWRRPFRRDPRSRRLVHHPCSPGRELGSGTLGAARLAARHRGGPPIHGRG